MGLALCAVISDPLAPQGPAVARGGTGSDQASKRQNPKQCCGLRFWSMFTTGKHFKVQKLHRRTQNPQTCAQLNLLHVQEKSPLREQLNYCAVCSRWPAQNSRSPWDASEFRKKNWKEDRQNINKTCKPVWRILKDFEGFWRKPHMRNLPWRPETKRQVTKLVKLQMPQMLRRKSVLLTLGGMTLPLPFCLVKVVRRDQRFWRARPLPFLGGETAFRPGTSLFNLVVIWYVVMMQTFRWFPSSFLNSACTAIFSHIA